MSSAVLFAILAVSSLATSFISGILGMAGGMILMGILLALLPLPAAMMLHGITQLASNAWRALLWRTEVDWRVFRGYAYGALLALAFFAAVRLVVGKPIALIVMGLLAFTGTSLSRRVLERMNDASFRLWTRWTVMGLGAFYLANGVFLLFR